MRKFSLGVVVALLVACASLPAAAAAKTFLSAGLTGVDGKFVPYAYAELRLNPTFALGLEYNRNVVAASAWIGAHNGFYGEVAVANGGGPGMAELGVWGSTEQGGMTLNGWVGAQTELGKASSLRVSVNGEALIPVADYVTAVVGAGTTLFAKDANLRAWIGIGYTF